ncbi:DUF3108 domain-containing protein [Moheibacter sediminis]|uniref:DUF3108 domain-containing protein n=1 Tax=Moheibacter sediminis TaxID=1434700 RepID=A0A1W2CVV4_9FLAO|nr:DUF3108 domain-containing protein [Moheibacter sediminis]SMC88838.1 Protein of unknown function [Moheibacter sediminis]
MKKFLLIFCCIVFTFSFVQNDSQNYESGELLKYRIHYGLLNAGFATLEVKSTTYEGKPHYHIVGEGSSSGAVRAFYKVDDLYETYIDKATNKPSKFVRKISEGGYTRDQVITFNHKEKTAKINDRKAQKVSYKEFSGNVQDLLSAFYYLRNLETDDLKTGDYMNVDILMADETYKFRLKILGRETVKTKFGKIKCIKIRPYVQSGRIFKESESVTMWVTDDANHIPVQIKAELMVGSLKAELHSYKNVKNTLNFTK